MNVTVDASVFVAQVKEGEPFNAASRECIVRLERPDWQLACPALVLPECAGALARTLDDQALTEALVELLRQFPGMTLVPLTTRLAQSAAALAAEHKLRGADAVYVAVAQQHEAILITLDAEMLERGAAVVDTVTPQDWLNRHSDDV